jgi:hypothetical protein
VLSKSKINLERRAGKWIKVSSKSVVDAVHLLPEGVRRVV